MVIFTFSVQGMISGYHGICRSPSPTDHLLFQREIGNHHDTYAVAITGNIAGVDSTTVRHVSKKISAICSIDVEELSIVL